MPKKGGKKGGKKSNADKKALAEAVAVPFALAVESHTAAEAAAEAGSVQEAARLFEAACGHYQAALTVKATDLDTLFNLGTACLQWSELDGLSAAQAEPLRAGACDYFRQVVALDTSQRSDSRADSLCNLVALLGTRGDLACEGGHHAEAEALYAEGCALEPSLPPEASMAFFNLGQIFSCRAQLAAGSVGPVAAVPLLQEGARCFEAVLGKPPQDPPIDVDALAELSASLLELARLTSLLPAPTEIDMAAQIVRVEELVSDAASRCAAVESLDPSKAEVVMELRMDIARLTASCRSVAMATSQQQAVDAAAAVEAAWAAAANACQHAATEAEKQGQGQELLACATYNAACIASLRFPVDENTAATCLRSAVEMALAAETLPEAKRSDISDSGFVSLSDLQHDSDLDAVRDCKWFKELAVQLHAGLAGTRVNTACDVTQAAISTRPIELVEAELMPLVKQGDAEVAAADLLAGLSSYSRALEGFNAAGHKRPTLQAKIDAVKAELGQQQAGCEADMES